MFASGNPLAKYSFFLFTALSYSKDAFDIFTWFFNAYSFASNSEKLRPICALTFEMSTIVKMDTKDFIYSYLIGEF